MLRNKDHCVTQQFHVHILLNNQQDEVVGEKVASWTKKAADPANAHQFTNLAHFIQNINTHVSYGLLFNLWTLRVF